MLFGGGGTLVNVPDFLMTDPDGIGASFSGYHQNAQGTLVGTDDVSGFGPGDYSGGYTGEGDRLYWGAFDDTPSTVPSAIPPSIGPGWAARHALAAGSPTQLPASSTGDTVLLPSTAHSQTSSHTAVDPLPDVPELMRGLPPIPSVSQSEIGPFASGGEMQAMQDDLNRQRLEAAAKGTESSVTDDRGIITETNISDSVAGPMSDYTSTSGTSVSQPSATTNTDYNFRKISPGGYGDVELQPMGTRGPPAASEFSGYRGDGSSVMSRPRSASASSRETLGVPDKGRVITGGDIELQDLRGPPSLHPELEADFEPSFPDELGNNFDESPFLLGDMPPAPPNSVFSFDAIDWDNVDPKALGAIGDYMQSEAGTEGSYLGSEGIGQNLGLFSRAGFANFLQSRVVDLGVGAALAPLFMWINDATGTPWVSRGIQGAMAVAGLAIGGDPFGVVAAPIVWGVQELMKQETRKLENDNPAANYGKRFGYVREGHKWYPAYLVRSERDEGWVGSDRTQIRLAYGTDLKFKRQKGTGKMIPYFDEGTYRQKDYHVWDNELDTTNEQSGKAWRDTADPLRDFYFLNDDETTDFLTKLGGGDTVSQYSDDRSHNFSRSEQDAIRASQTEAFDMMKVHDDVSWGDTWAEHGNVSQVHHYGQYDQYLRTVQDIRSGLELWQDYLTSEPGNIYTTHSDEDQYSGARAFRRVINESGYLGYPVDNKDQMSRPMGSTAAEMQENALGGSVTAEGSWLVEERRKAMSILYESQKRVGTSMHFDKLFGDVSKVPEGAPGWLTPYFKAGENAKSAGFRGSTEESAALHDKWDQSKGSIDQYAWRLYSDGTWEIGDVTSDEGLADALRHIEAAGDSGLIGTSDYRSADQRDFLANKAYVRYLNGKLDQMGIAEVAPQNTDVMGRTTLDTQQGWKEFGLSPTYSYADDYAEWGWSTKPTRSTYDPHHETQTADFKLSSEELNQAQVQPEWMRQLNDYVIKDGLSPDQVAGRYDSADDYKTALGIISQRDPAYYAPADESLEPVPGTGWDAWGEGIAEGQQPYDNVQHAFVRPRDKTPGLVYDPASDTYVHPDAPPDAQPDEGFFYHDKAPAVSNVKDKVDPPLPTPSGHDGSEWSGFGSDWGATAATPFAPEQYFDDHSVPYDPEFFYVEEAPQPEEPAEPAPAVPGTPAQVPGTGSHVHEEAPDEVEQPPLPVYMQEQHRERVFQHSSAPMHLPPTHAKVI